MKTRGKKTVQIVSTADIASAPSTNQSQIVTYPNAGPSTIDNNLSSTVGRWSGVTLVITHGLYPAASAGGVST